MSHLLLLLVQLLCSRAAGGAGWGFGIRGLVFGFVVQFSWRTDTIVMTQENRMRRTETKLKAVSYPSSCAALHLPQCLVLQERLCTQRQILHMKTPVTLNVCPTVCPLPVCLESLLQSLLLLLQPLLLLPQLLLFTKTDPGESVTVWFSLERVLHPVSTHSASCHHMIKSLCVTTAFGQVETGGDNVTSRPSESRYLSRVSLKVSSDT